MLADAGCSDVIAKLIMPYSLLKLSDDMRFDSKRAEKQHNKQGCLQSTCTCHTPELKHCRFKLAARSGLFSHFTLMCQS